MALLRKLRAMHRSLPARDQLPMRIGAAKIEAGHAFGFVQIQLPGPRQAVTRESFRFSVDKQKLKDVEQRDGHYLLRSNVSDEDPAVLWTRYVQLTQIESVFRCLKGELGIRRYQAFLERSVEAEVLGMRVKVACLEDVTQGKLWAFGERRLSKRKKD